MDVRLDGKNALITGGSMGLGKAMALRFAEAGASVVIGARRDDVLRAAREEIAAIADGGTVAAIQGDVSTADGCAHIYAEAETTLGSIDILVNNAGTSAASPFLEVSDDDWQTDFDLKLFAAIRLCRLALPGMMARKWGRILNVLAFIAKAPPASTSPTSVSRAAGLALTKILANEAAPHGVLVNALMTGLVDSNQWVVRHAQLDDGSSYQSFLDGMATGIPLGRVGEAEEFANLALFLASDRASYLTGTAINVDGGKSPVW
jgi:NAD(P)-dependent dehydrogenase (short-subunit alcohol dehydrogenase family)